MQNIIFINQKKCFEYWLDLNHGAMIFLVSKLNTWATSIDVDWEIYYYLTTKRILNRLPTISNEETVQKMINHLVDIWIIKSINKANARYFNLTEKWKEFNPKEI